MYGFPQRDFLLQKESSFPGMEVLPVLLPDLAGPYNSRYSWFAEMETPRDDVPLNGFPTFPLRRPLWELIPSAVGSFLAWTLNFISIHGVPCLLLAGDPPPLKGLSQAPDPVPASAFPPSINGLGILEGNRFLFPLPTGLLYFSPYGVPSQGPKTRIRPPCAGSPALESVLLPDSAIFRKGVPHAVRCTPPFFPFFTDPRAVPFSLGG